MRFLSARHRLPHDWMVSGRHTLLPAAATGGPGGSPSLSDLRKSLDWPRLMLGLTVVLLSTTAMMMARAMDPPHLPSDELDGTTVQERLPDTPEAPRSAVSLSQGKASARSRCEECGVISSVRHITAAGDAPARYEFTVRQRDGSIRKSSDASPGKWRAGDRILLIGSGDTPVE